MRGLQISLWGMIVVGVCLYFGSQYKAKQDELDVVTAVAETFLSSAKNGDSGSSFALATKSYQERFPEARSESKTMDSTPVRAWGWSLVEKYLSANGNQAILIGRCPRLKARDGVPSGLAIMNESPSDPHYKSDFEEIEFRMVLVKETDSWRLDVLTYEKTARSK